MIDQAECERLRRRLLDNRRITPSGCWIWTKSLTHNGYGQTAVSGRSSRVHRVAAMLWLDFDLGSPLCVLHRCDERACFRPSHLFVGTVADNQRDMAAKGRGRNGQTTQIRAETREEARRLVRGGLSRRETSRRLGLSHTAVQTLCRDIPVERWAKPRRSDSNGLEVARARIRAGEQRRDVVRDLGLLAADSTFLAHQP